MFLTRIGENSKMIIDGSITQCDIRNSGLAEAVKRLKGVPLIGMVEFDTDDIVRHGIIKDILMAYAA
jgi:phosphate starvation-inducible PhoH-like protein